MLIIDQKSKETANKIKQNILNDKLHIRFNLIL